MKLLALLLLCAGLAAGTRADSAFPGLKSILTAAEWQRAGLEQLTPRERNRHRSVAIEDASDTFGPMTTLTAQAEITSDHRLKLDVPVSPDVPAGRIEVTVALVKSPQKLVSNNRKAVSILREIAARGRVLVPDPVAWQREVREDRPLPGRD